MAVVIVSKENTNWGLWIVESISPIEEMRTERCATTQIFID
jgi:hypothetical protein